MQTTKLFYYVTYILFCCSSFFVYVHYLLRIMVLECTSCLIGWSLAHDHANENQVQSTIVMDLALFLSARLCANDKPCQVGNASKIVFHSSDVHLTMYESLLVNPLTS